MQEVNRDYSYLFVPAQSPEEETETTPIELAESSKTVSPGNSADLESRPPSPMQDEGGPSVSQTAVEESNLTPYPVQLASSSSSVQSCSAFIARKLSAMGEQDSSDIPKNLEPPRKSV